MADLQGEGGTDGILGVPQFLMGDAVTAAAACSCCFCCCLNLDSWKKRLRMALRLPSRMSLAWMSPTATPMWMRNLTVVREH